LRRLTNFLEDQTDSDWDVTQAHSETETGKERDARERQALFDEARRHPAVAAALEAIPGAEIVNVETVQAIPLEPDDAGEAAKPVPTKNKG